MNMQPSGFMDCDDGWRRQVAAEVAARYGAIVSPDVVKRIPAGISAEPTPIWDGKRELVYPDKAASWRVATDRAYAMRKRKSAKPTGGSVTAAVQDRRAKLAVLHSQGLTDPEIAQALGVGVSAVRKDRKALELLPAFLTTKRGAAQERVARVIDALCRNIPARQIAAAENLTIETVKGIGRDKLGLSWPNGASIGVPHVSRDEKRRMREVALPDLIRSGKSLGQIADLLQTSRGQIMDIAQELGLSLPSNRRTLPPDVVARLAARRAGILDLLRQGKSVSFVKRFYKISGSAFLADCAALRQAGLMVGLVPVPKHLIAPAEQMREAA